MIGGNWRSFAFKITFKLRRVIRLPLDPIVGIGMLTTAYVPPDAQRREEGVVRRHGLRRPPR